MSKILKRKERLELARVDLKTEFVGIDDQIDEVIDLVHSWYCFPEGQIRPTVINLVGMTGVGKTSVIDRLFQLLDMENVYYKFDMGYYASNTENLKHELSKKVKSYDKSPICFVFDEFQLCRSVDGEGEEIDRSNFRPIWDLLDSGKINLIEPNYGIEALYSLMLRLERCIENGVLSKGLRITKGEKYFLDVFGKDGYDDGDEDGEADINTPSMIPNSYYYYILQCVPNRFIGNGELRRFLSNLKDEDSIVNFLRETIELAGKPKVYDFSNSIIFVIANVDEAFVSAKDMDPDMDADAMHELSLEISLFDIKQSLRTRFRSEQIARLGNNYVIYPSLSSDTYRKLIDIELNKKSVVIKEKFGIDVEFDRSTRKIIYNEGVFPTQGTRPVFTTINYIIGSFVGRILAHLEEHDMMKDIGKLEWKFKNNKNKIALLSKRDGSSMGELVYELRIKVESLRKTKLNDEQALISVHEAGHAVVSAALLGHIPSKVMSSTAGASEGFNLIKWNNLKGRDYAISMASVYLAGIEAERLVFGVDQCTSEGSEGDIVSATELISSMVQTSGVYHPMVRKPNPNRDKVNVVMDVDHKTTALIISLLEGAKEKAKAILNKHKAALVALSLELFKKPVLEKKRIAEIFNENGLSTEDKNTGYFKDTLLRMVPEGASK